jgi:hypothetical protein
LACQGGFFVTNPLDVKENDEHALDFVLGESGLSNGRIVALSLVTSDNSEQEGCIIGDDLTMLLTDTLTRCWF